ncbi:MAG: HEPN domain protein [Candidatus Bathyarchaeota archaeon BA2]|nr:MAG: HEPN domain protein [Candidatus Bathyarchaeota archaeon BA2]
MSKFKDTAKLFLKDAEKDVASKRYASCVIHAHLVIEHTLKARLVEKGVSPKFKTLPDLTHQALKSDLIDHNMSKQILDINSLRNKIYHEGYIPTGREAIFALATTKKLL